MTNSESIYRSSRQVHCGALDDAVNKTLWSILLMVEKILMRKLSEGKLPKRQQWVGLKQMTSLNDMITSVSPQFTAAAQS